MFIFKKYIWIIYIKLQKFPTFFYNCFFWFFPASVMTTFSVIVLSQPILYIFLRIKLGNRWSVYFNKKNGTDILDGKWISQFFKLYIVRKNKDEKISVWNGVVVRSTLRTLLVLIFLFRFWYFFFGSDISFSVLIFLFQFRYFFFGSDISFSKNWIKTWRSCFLRKLYLLDVSGNVKLKSISIDNIYWRFLLAISIVNLK